MELSVIIVNWNLEDALKACLESVESSLKDLDHEVIVIDNASSDGSVRMLKDVFPGVRLIENQDNAGFARANNQGIALSRGGYLLLLNPDTLVPPAAIQHLLAFMLANPEAAVAGPALADGNGSVAGFRPEIYLFPCLKDELVLDTILNDLSSFVHYTAGFFKRHGTAGPAAAEPVESDWVSGACMLVRREAADAAGPMDERFFLYMEELEWCYRLKREHGWKIFILPSVNIIHTGGSASSKIGTVNVFRIYYDSRYKFFEKHWNSRLVPLLRAAKSSLLALSLLKWFFLKFFSAGRREEASDRIAAYSAVIPIVLKIRGAVRPAL